MLCKPLMNILIHIILDLTRLTKNESFQNLFHDTYFDETQANVFVNCDDAVDPNIPTIIKFAYLLMYSLLEKYVH